jgi:hypothetical protein
MANPDDFYSKEWNSKNQHEIFTKYTLWGNPINGIDIPRPKNPTPAYDELLYWVFEALPQQEILFLERLYRES